MLQLSRLYHRYAYVIPENRRIISEQRDKIDAAAIVSIDEFIEKIMNPQREVGGPMQEFFAKHGNRIEKTLFHWCTFDHIESFNIKPEMMSDEDRAIMEERALRLSKNNQTSLGLLEEIRDVINDENNQAVEEAASYPALNIGMVVLAIDAVSKKQNSLLSLENKTITTGYAQTMCNFWFELGELKDYSTFFPHKPKPMGNDRNNDSNKEKSRGFAPIFPGNSGWKPA